MLQFRHITEEPNACDYPGLLGREREGDGERRKARERGRGTDGARERGRDEEMFRVRGQEENLLVSYSRGGP